ncbi:hypothetical protein [Coraliomargarita akajimensis]|uniref:Uncharacterized protein n=1 Tax=Coraliomargarita akajimensis (strain DSM 45221 / IAM 15411 / JCM 23193 / KCTC 12865 / 04OKA010-24) TaxID=583355 RepID=D5EJG2_CORAD|nr:hypothetical protein [Coraliomargarita akajimensis]ADE54561.1 hypothetical protein Caka_1542 [Coraliomargarita akajimensis DSM 45221]
MKALFQTFLAISSLVLTSTLFAGTEAGKDSARHYKSYPEKYDNKTVSIDCTFVTRINGGPQVDGIAFFVAHTADTDNNMRGGAIVVAVAEADADKLVKKFGNTPEINENARKSTADRVDSKRLRGTFHQLEKGTVYIDLNGDAHETILEKAEAAKGKIRAGDGIPSTSNKGPRGPHPHKKNT